jgi:hypothetical protein
MVFSVIISMFAFFATEYIIAAIELLSILIRYFCKIHACFTVYFGVNYGMAKYVHIFHQLFHFISHLKLLIKCKKYLSLSSYWLQCKLPLQNLSQLFLQCF